MNHVKAQSVEQVLAKLPFAGKRFKVGVGGAHDPDIDLQGTLASEALEFAILHDSQQLFLQPQRHGGQFIEKQGAALSALKAPGMAATGAGERTCLVSE